MAGRKTHKLISDKVEGFLWPFSPSKCKMPLETLVSAHLVEYMLKPETMTACAKSKARQIHTLITHTHF